MATTQDVPFDMIKRLRVADYITLSNAFCGVLSMFFSIQQQPILSYVFIYVGYQCDCFDGMVARWRNECSEWGKELDSFSDMITFVLAPAVMLFCVGLRTPVDQLGLAFYVLCGLTRLVRFNMVVGLVPKNKAGRASYIEGVPTAYAALIISTTVAMLSWTGGMSQGQGLGSVFPDTFYEVHGGTLPVLVLSVSMASKRLRFSFDGTWSVPIVTAAVFIGGWWKSSVSQ